MFSSQNSQVSNDAVFVEDIFSTTLYTGTGASQTQTNNIDLAGKGGLVWLKKRSAAESNYLQDSSSSFANSLVSNTTAAALVGSGIITSVSSTGFTTSSVSSGTTYASWTFRKQPKFFDVVTYTGDGTAGRTVAHNLGSVPGCMIVKRTDAVVNWGVYHNALGPTGFLVLNSTAADAGSSAPWNSTSPTSTQFTLGSSVTTNASGGTYVAYLFAHNAGGFGLTGTDNVISCGSYTGNGSTSGPSVTLGYEPQFVMIKNATATGNWGMYDVMRGIPTGGSTALLSANTTAAETTGSGNLFDVTATGFQLKTTSSLVNTSGEQYIYIAIRRGPMKAPTTGTSVFARVARSGTSTYTTTTAGFPIDLAFTKVRTTTNGANVVARLTSNRLLQTSASSADEADTTQDRYQTNPFDNQTSLKLGDAVNGLAFTNDSGFTYVDWMFRRAPSFMDVVCYTGTGTSTTTQVSHNLTVIPELIILKERNGATNWKVMCALNGSSSPNLRYGMELNTTITGYLDTAGAYQTYTTSAYFNPWLVGAGVPSTNTSGKTYVAYLFATCAGVSKVGSYTGTGTTKQVDCGFAAGARFVLIKRADASGDWYVWDSARGIVAGNDPYLLLNASSAEVTNTDYIDTYSAGFEISSTAPAAINANGGTFIFLAIA